MKHSLITVFLLFLTLTSYPQDKKSEKASDVTTYYFIRHAEKDRSNPSEKDPHLKVDGLKRADNWSTILGHIKFDAIYSTDYHRTMETAQPTADKNKLEIIVYDPNTINTPEAFLKDTKGKTVLIVGHSNTTPAFVNAVLGNKKYENIDDDNNGNLYLVTIVGDKMVDQLFTIN